MSLFGGAANAALESAESCWPAVTPVSSAAGVLGVGSIEYFLATASQLWPLCSAALAALASACGLGQHDPRLRVSGVPNCDLWLL